MVWAQKTLPLLNWQLPVLVGRQRHQFLKTCESKAFSVAIGSSPIPLNSKHESFRSKNYKSAFGGRIVSVKDIRKIDSPIEKTLLVQIELDDPAATFSLADNMAFFPKNTKPRVQKVVRYFELDPHSFVNLVCQENKEAEIVTPFPSGLRVKELLRNHLDLHAPVTFAHQKSRPAGPEPRGSLGFPTQTPENRRFRPQLPQRTHPKTQESLRFGG